MTPEEEISLYEKAKTELITHGWTNKGSYLEPTGEVCTFGAVMAATGAFYFCEESDMWDYNDADNVLVPREVEVRLNKLVLDRSQNCGFVINWNDDEATGINDVITLFDDAILDVKEEARKA